MVGEVASVGGMSAHEAFLLLFSEALGVHSTDGAEDGAFFQEYVVPSVMPMDTGSYRENPYYRNIRIPTVSDGRWDLKTEHWEPYHCFVRDDLWVGPDLKELPLLGYFTESFDFPAVLEDGREWMMVTPNEVETIRPAVNAARGKVVTFGLGLGYFAYMVSEKPEVSQVTVVEKDPSVIRLFNHYILPQFGHPEKVTIVEEDAFRWAEKVLPRENYDYAYADTWHDAQDGVPMYCRMKRLELLSPQTRFDYWVEETLLSYIRSEVYEELLKGTLRSDDWARTLSGPALKEWVKKKPA